MPNSTVAIDPAHAGRRLSCGYAGLSQVAVLFLGAPARWKSRTEGMPERIGWGFAHLEKAEKNYKIRSSLPKD